MAAKLGTLRVRLGDLQRRRSLARGVIAFSAVIVAVLLGLVALFATDWLFEMNRVQRVLMAGLCAGGVWWAYRKFAVPFLGVHETVHDMALLVERQQRIDSDLIAALQFETPHASNWGSAQLQDAVVDYVAEFGKGLNVYEGLSYQQWRQRMLALAVTVGVVTAGVAARPDFARAFVQRCFLLSTHYPTRTMIAGISLNGKKTYPATFSNVSTRSAYGRPLKFEVTCTGEIPPEGKLRLISQQKVETVLDLRPVNVAASSLAGNNASAAGSAMSKPVVGGSATTPPSTTATTFLSADPVAFSVELPRLVDNLSYQVYLGDAWTEPLPVEVIPLAVVTIDLDHTPPQYAAAVAAMQKQQRPEDADKKSESGARQIAVVEGSRVHLTLSCGNKTLSAARLTIGQKEFALRKSDARGKQWTLPVDDTPFAEVTEPISFRIQVEDDDGLSLESPLQGHVRIQADRIPRISWIRGKHSTSAAKSERVLATAKPPILFDAKDDYGIATIRLHRQVVRHKGEIEQGVDTLVSVDEKQQPRPGLNGQHVLDLQALKLNIGDEVRFTLEAIDYRGGRPGQSALSEPIVLQITDQAGIMASQQELNEKALRQVDGIIERQLGIGDKP